MGVWGHQRWSVYPHHVRPGPWEETLWGKDRVKYRAEHIRQSIDLVHRVDGSWCGGGRRVGRGGGEGGEVWFSSGRGRNI